MGFETFIPRRMITREAKITILEAGIFWINFITTRKFLKGFKRTYVLYDKERKVIGFKPTNEQKHTYSLSRAKGRNDITVSGMAFLEYYKIPHKERKSYKATWNDKERLVEIDLNQPL